MNNHGQYGRWAFAEFTEVYQIEPDFEARVEDEFDRMTCASLEDEATLTRRTRI